MKYQIILLPPKGAFSIRFWILNSIPNDWYLSWANFREDFFNVLFRCSIIENLIKGNEALGTSHLCYIYRKNRRRILYRFYQDTVHHFKTIYGHLRSNKGQMVNLYWEAVWMLLICWKTGRRPSSGIIGKKLWQVWNRCSWTWSCCWILARTHATWSWRLYRNESSRFSDRKYQFYKPEVTTYKPEVI